MIIIMVMMIIMMKTTAVLAQYAGPFGRLYKPHEHRILAKNSEAEFLEMCAVSGHTHCVTIETWLYTQNCIHRAVRCLCVRVYTTCGCSILVS